MKEKVYEYGTDEGSRKNLEMQTRWSTSRSVHEERL